MGTLTPDFMQLQAIQLQQFAKLGLPQPLQLAKPLGQPFPQQTIPGLLPTPTGMNITPHSQNIANHLQFARQMAAAGGTLAPPLGVQPALNAADGQTTGGVGSTNVATSQGVQRAAALDAAAAMSALSAAQGVCVMWFVTGVFFTLLMPNFLAEASYSTSTVF